jgi:hypothetical protein
MLPKIVLVAASVALMSTGAMAAGPDPCNVRKTTTVTTDKNGKEILTSKITADCGFDANALERTRKLESTLREVQNRLHYIEERQKPVVVAKVPKAAPVEPVQEVVLLGPVDKDPLLIDYKGKRVPRWNTKAFLRGFFNGLREGNS